ncbi:hypothetical protein [Chitinophaga vietnamensis]|uniref:hypothetical protein n=1 Tax=Chitinophaga vietnamensis TaxID=2593957 RepID=UPI0011785E02|nr:hypothetical protein [Chitinophaga vietnamensis]
MLNDVLKDNKWYYLGAIVLIIALATFYLNTYVLTDSLYYNSFSGKLTVEQIENALGIKKRYLWASLLMIPALLFIKITFNSTAVYTSAFLHNCSAGFSGIFDLCVKAELVFIVPLVLKISLLTFFKSPETLDDCNIMPLSVHSLLRMIHLPNWSVYPLQFLNVFEVFYVLLLSKLFSIRFGMSFRKSFSIAGIGYLSGMALWILVVAFLTITYL